MVTVWLRSRPPMRFRAVLAVILVPKCCLIATVAGPIRLGRPTAVSRFCRASARWSSTRAISSRRRLPSARQINSSQSVR